MVLLWLTTLWCHYFISIIFLRSKQEDCNWGARWEESYEGTNQVGISRCTYWGLSSTIFIKEEVDNGIRISPFSLIPSWAKHYK